MNNLNSRDEKLAQRIAENIIDEQQRPQREREREEARRIGKGLRQQEIREIWGDGTSARIMEISSWIFIIAVLIYILVENLRIIVAPIILIFPFYVMHKIIAHYVYSFFTTKKDEGQHK